MLWGGTLIFSDSVVKLCSKEILASRKLEYRCINKAKLISTIISLRKLLEFITHAPK